MDLIRKITLSATLVAALFAVDAARGQSRPNVLTRGVGSTTAQGASRGSTRVADPIFVAPSAGVNEDARGVGVYDVAPSPAAASPNALYAEASSEASLEEEKAQAAAIIAQTKERAAARKHVVSRPINAPMTLKALKDKPQTTATATAQSGQTARRPANAPQFLQYSPSMSAANAARPDYNSGWLPAQPQASAQPTSQPASTTAPALNWDGSTRKEFGRSQPPTTAAPFSYDAISTNPNDVNIDKASFAISGFEPQIAQDADSAQESSPVFGGLDPEQVGVPAGEASDEEEDEIPPFVAPSQEALDKIGVETNDVVESAPTPQGPEPLTSDAILDDVEIDENDLEVAIPTADDLLDAATSEPEIEPVAVEPVVVEPIAVEPSPVEPVLVDPAAIDVPDSTPNPNDPIPVEPAAAEPNASLDDASNQVEPATIDEPEQATAPQVEPAQVEPAQEEPANEEPAAPSPNTDANAQNAQNTQTDASRAQFAYDVMTYATPAITCAPELHPMANRLAPASPNAYLAYGPSCDAPQATAPSRVVGFQAPVRQPGALVVSPAYEANPYVRNVRAPYAFASERSEATTRPYGFLFGAEWLAWQTDADLPYAQKVNRTGATIDERDLQADGSGLRGRVGFRGVDGWDIIGTFTWYDQNDDGSVNSDETSTLVSPKQGGADFDAISGKLKTDLQVVDVEIGRWNDRCGFAFRPFLGFRWTQLNLETSDAFSALSASGAELLDGTVSVVDGATDSEKAFSNAVADSELIGVGSLYSKSRLNAYGLRLGADVELALAQGLAIYGKGAGTLAVGDVKSTTAYVGEGGYNGEIKKTYFTPSVEGGVGLSWKINGLDVRGGYEFNAWYNAANMNGRKSDFIAHGVVAGLGYNY